MSHSISSKPACEDASVPRQQSSSDLTRPAPQAIVPAEPDIDLDEARQFLDLLDPGGTFTFQTFPDDKKAAGPPLTRVFHGSLEDHVTSLVSLNYEGAGIFVMVNEGDGTVRKGQRTCRTAKNVVRVRAVFVDLDGAPLGPVLEATPSPSIVVESSPGRWHAYWLVDDCPLDQFKAIQGALASRFQGDPKVSDLPRVMRLPGFIHRKQTPFMSRILQTLKEGE